LGFEKFSTISQVRSISERDASGEVDPTYDVREFLPGFEEYADKFIDTVNAEQAEQLQQEILADQGRDQALSSMPFWSRGNAGVFVGAMLDPINLAAVVKGPVAFTRGAKAAYSAWGTATKFAGIEAVAEALRMEAQPTRTGEEAAITVGSVALFGAMFGGVAGAMSGESKSLLAQHIESVVSLKPIKAEIDGDLVHFTGPKSLSAAAAEGNGLDFLDPTLSTKIGFRVTQPLDVIQTPLYKGFMSKSSTYKDFTDNLFDRHIELKGDEFGHATPKAQLLHQTDMVTTAKSMQKLDELYMKTLGIDKDMKFKQTRTLVKQKNKEDLPFKTRDSFDIEVIKTIMTNRDSPFPEVNQAAKLISTDIYKFHGNRLKEVRVFDEGLDVSEQSKYFSRMWNKEKIELDPNGFEAMAIRSLKKLKSNVSELEVIVKNLIKEEGLTAADKAKLSKLEKRIALAHGVDDGDMALLADQARRSIIGMGDRDFQLVQLTRDMPTSEVSFQKVRTLDWIDPEDSLDWIDTNVKANVSSYAKNASAIYQFQKALERTGHKNMKELLESIANDYDQQIEALLPGKELIKQKKKLIAQKKQAIEDATVAAQVFLGRFGKHGKGEQGWEALRLFQTTRLLGKVLLSSMADPATQVREFGPLKTLYDGYLPLFRSIKESRLSKQEALDWEIANEVAMAEQFQSVVNPGHAFGRQKTKMEGILEETSHIFNRATGLADWNGGLKSRTAHMGRARLVRVFDKLNKKGTLTKKDKKKLAQAGIPESMYDRIKREMFVNENATEYKGSFLLHYERWDDIEARDLVRGAVRHYTNAGPITPGPADIPTKFVGSGFAKSVTQFKSFTSGMANLFIIPAINARDAATAMSIVTMIGLATESYIIKSYLAGREPNMDPLNLVLEGISRSAVLGLMGDAIFTGAGKFGFMRQRKGRFGDRSASQFFGGPSAFLIEDALDLSADITTQGMTDRNLRKMTRFLPLQNLFYLEYLIRKASEGKGQRKK
jgi:hypothetical protein